MEIKTIYIINCFSTIIIGWCAYLWLDHQALWLYSILMIFDYITWIIKWIIQKDLKSKTAIYGLISKIFILFVIFSIWITGKILGFWMSGILSGLLWAFALAELYSIVGNAYEIHTRKKFTEFDALTFSFSFILWKVKENIEKIDRNFKK